MTVGIIHAFLRWVLDVFKPGTGKRRADARPTPPASGHTPERPCTAALRLPAHRSPYGLHPVLDGETAAMVRPYVITWEREFAAHERALQHRRRTALVLAAEFGVDLDQHLIGAGAVAR
ncbi:hypothetical protein GCM10017771_33000 [Streptomyces capitiformicae]|uniref:Uncharacterized protein n=1 Tax=Streptomyces capitiformicae TaxID=2014920 RepID=A0A919GR27_9ACTN|nr:hypothetical protein [Streptomyces capitiformicae]GHH88305.1 hypothetical protein GCM10017771_33000 [Streptomyces capitiformicae]